MRAKLTKIILLGLLLISLGATTAYAYQIDNNYRPVNLPFALDYTEKTPESNTIMILQLLAGGLLYFAAPVAIIMIAMAGSSMIIGGAETDKVDQAKKNLTWSVVGLIVIIMSYSIVKAVLDFVVEAGADEKKTTQDITMPGDDEFNDMYDEKDFDEQNWATEGDLPIEKPKEISDPASMAS